LNFFVEKILILKREDFFQIFEIRFGNLEIRYKSRLTNKTLKAPIPAKSEKYKFLIKENFAELAVF